MTTAAAATVGGSVGGSVPDPLPVLARGLAIFPLPAGANIGVGCWRSQVVVDLDVPGAEHHTTVRGADSLAAACASYGQPWPDTFTVGTPSGGRHLYFAALADVVIGPELSRTPPRSSMSLRTRAQAVRASPARIAAPARNPM